MLENWPEDATYVFPNYDFLNYDHQFLTQSNTDLFELTEEAER